MYEVSAEGGFRMSEFAIAKQVSGVDEFGREAVTAVLTFNGQIIGTIDAAPEGALKDVQYRFYGRGLTVGSLGFLTDGEVRYSTIGSSSASSWRTEPTADEVAEKHLRTA